MRAQSSNLRRRLLIGAASVAGAVAAAIAGGLAGSRLKVQEAELHQSAPPRLVVSGAHG